MIEFSLRLPGVAQEGGSRERRSVSSNTRAADMTFKVGTSPLF